MLDELVSKRDHRKRKLALGGQVCREHSHQPCRALLNSNFLSFSTQTHRLRGSSDIVLAKTNKMLSCRPRFKSNNAYLWEEATGCLSLATLIVVPHTLATTVLTFNSSKLVYVRFDNLSVSQSLLRVSLGDRQ